MGGGRKGGLGRERVRASEGGRERERTGPLVRADSPPLLRTFHSGSTSSFTVQAALLATGGARQPASRRSSHALGRWRASRAVERTAARPRQVRATAPRESTSPTRATPSLTCRPPPSAAQPGGARAVSCTVPSPPNLVGGLQAARARRLRHRALRKSACVAIAAATPRQASCT